MAAWSGNRLVALAVRRPVTVAMSLVALLVVGVIADRQIPLQLLPSGFNPPFMWVGVPTLPGAPSDHERAIAEPLEAVLATLPKLERMRTIIEATSVGFALRFRPDVDLAAAYSQVRERLDRVAPQLPDGVQPANIWRWDPNDEAIFIVGLTYPKSVSDPQYVISRFLRRPLERLPGVGNTRVRGVRAQKVRIAIDEGLASSHGIQAEALVRRLRRDNFTLSAGALEDAGRRVLVRSVSRFEDLDTIRSVPVADGVRLGDVARVYFGPDHEPVIHRIDGHPAATLHVFKEGDANTVDVSRRIAARLDELLRTTKALEGFEPTVFFDQGDQIGSALEQLRRAAIYGGAIAVALLFLFLRSVGTTLLVTVAIPLCLLVTVVALFFLGDSLNLLSMMGLMLSVGMVIDNAIVAVENIDRYRHQGLAPAQASTRGASEVALAITLATLTTMVVFLPLMLLNQSPELSFFLRKIGSPVCLSLAASLFVALVYIPCGTRFFRPPRSSPEGRSGEGRLRRIYVALLDTALRHRLITTLLIVGAVASTALPLSQVKTVDRIEANAGAVRLIVRGPPNGSLEELDETLRELEERVIARKEALEIRAVLTRETWSAHRGMVQAFFVAPDQRTLERTEVVEALRALLPDRPGYRSRIGWHGSAQGGGSEGGMTIEVRGPDTALATELAEALAARLQAHPLIGGASVDEGRTGSELRFVIDREAADRAGLTPLQIGGALDYTLRGRRLGFFHTPTREVEMLVELEVSDREDVRQLAEMPVPGGSGPGSPPALGSLARTVRAPGYGRIVRRNQRSAVPIQVTGDDQVIFKPVAEVLAAFPLPPTYTVDMGDRFDRRQQNESGGRFALLLSIALVFFIMGVLFESFVLPFSILLSIPLAFAGVGWMLYLTDTPLDVMAIIGCIILVGVVVNNGIVLIEQVQRRRREGASRRQALLDGARHRVRPILMTALTTIGGLVPMAVGRAGMLGIEYHPLARVVIGGLIAGTLLTLFAVPVFYTCLDDLRGLPGRARVFWRRAPCATLGAKPGTETD